MKKKKILRELKEINATLNRIVIRIPPRTIEWKRWVPPEKMFTGEEEESGNHLELYLERKYGGNHAE